MDQKIEGEQIAMEPQCQHVLPVADKSCSGSSTPLKKLHLEVNFISPTPEKTVETSNVRCKKGSTELPEKYRILSEFFDRMTTSLRLLNLRKGLPTFKNICRQVETLTGRKFSYGHLAQIKFILPEAVQTDKILLHNKKILCMEPDIKVTLVFDVVQGHVEHSAHIALCNAFSDRLFEFISTHSEGCDIPEAELPEPFNRSNMAISANPLAVDSSTETLLNINEAELLNTSHLNPSFGRHFSRKEANEETEKTKLSSPPVFPFCIKKKTALDSCVDSENHEKSVEVTSEDTPMKPILEPGVLIVETPALSTPKRSVASEDNKLKSIVSQKVTANNVLAKRVLDFSNADGEESLSKANSAFSEEKISHANVSSEKVEESDGCSSEDEISPSRFKTHQNPSGSLSDLVDTIDCIFQSAHCSSITKSELVHKILVNNFDVVETGEIEEQLELLENKVPEWISKSMVPSGDVLYNIKKGLDLKSIREKLM